MAKISYKVPTSLDQSYLDMEIPLQTKSGVGLKILPVKVLLVYIFSLMLLAWVLMKTYMKELPLPIMILYGLFWLVSTVIFAKYSKTKEMQFSLISPFLSYLPARNRKILTRADSNASAFWGLLNIQNISDDGLISYVDGTSGFMFRVVGSASILLFEDDRDAILDRVDNFYKKFPNDCEIISITAKESQKVYKQVANLKLRYNNLAIRDPELLALLEEQFRVLKDFVGSEFKSIHQYWILKADNKEALKQATNILRAEVENSARMIKFCTPLDKEDTISVLQGIYRN